MGKYEISHEFMQEVTDYLVSRPYKEVYKILDGIRSLKLVEEDSVPPGPVTESQPPTEGNA